jgi:hypothetical protein
LYIPVIVIEETVFRVTKKNVFALIYELVISLCFLG